MITLAEMATGSLRPNTRSSLRTTSIRVRSSRWLTVRFAYMYARRNINIVVMPFAASVMSTCHDGAIR